MSFLVKPNIRQFRPKLIRQAIILKVLNFHNDFHRCPLEPMLVATDSNVRYQSYQRQEYDA